MSKCMKDLSTKDKCQSDNNLIKGYLPFSLLLPSELNKILQEVKVEL